MESREKGTVGLHRDHRDLLLGNSPGTLVLEEPRGRGSGSAESDRQDASPGCAQAAPRSSVTGRGHLKATALSATLCSRCPRASSTARRARTPAARKNRNRREREREKSAANLRCLDQIHPRHCCGQRRLQPQETNTACGLCWRLPLSGTVSPQVKGGRRGERGRRDAGSRPRSPGAAPCACYRLIPALPLPSPSPDTSYHHVPSSRACTPGTLNPRRLCCRCPQRHSIRMEPSRHPNATAGRGSSFLCRHLPALQGRSQAPLLWAPEPHLFPRWFSRIPFAATRQGESWGRQDAATLPRPLAPPDHRHPEYFYSLATSCHSPPQEKTFPSYFMGQNLDSSFAAHHRTLQGPYGWRQ
ncbi:uncharacterized protein LOC119710405 [Motacilla alba alba]|uniref:uncharacterized protein LOC119710405 n=1 Tax=Motacilla alba alba TaxID=1094192 RepID=UPI0018D55B77|nr:uncharacterized protein LOC119710405 [Motacilla alba alba]